MHPKAILSLVAVFASACSPIFAQEGTFGGGAPGMIGGAGGSDSSSSKKQKPPQIVTKDTISGWVKANMKIAKNRRLQAAKNGDIVSTSKNGVERNEKINRYRFRSREDINDEITRLTAETLSKMLPVLSTLHLQTGQIGGIAETNIVYRVVQVLDGNIAMIPVSAGPLESSFFVTGPLVTNLQEDQRIGRFPGCFVVEDKQRYTTVIGTGRRLPVLRSYDLAPHLVKLEAERKNK
jgi:hypothetical protein